jgi:hypothetical protein
MVSKLRYEQNKDDILSRQREYRLRNLGKVRQAQAKYYKENADYIKAKSNAWRENNPERKRQANQQWAIKNPEKDELFLTLMKPLWPWIRKLSLFTAKLRVAIVH